MAKAIAGNPQMLRVKPSIIMFLLKYLSKFKVRNVGGQLVVHSHLPPMTSRAYTRFINEHFLKSTSGPSHAQIGLTNACPQNCIYCYNKDRSGKAMDKNTIKRTIAELKKMGVIWLGFTGGEPLLNKNIVEITDSLDGECAVKLFTTGFNLTPKLAKELRDAGMLYMSVSLDSRHKDVHDAARRYPGAYDIALNAIKTIQDAGGIHLSVSSVFTKEMMNRKYTEDFLEFLIDLNVDEAWISEVKPSVEAFWNKDTIISEAERKAMCELQDEYNKKSKITVNYLGHFEGAEHYGCNAGNKMVYIDAFGEVSPCVFTPMSFGNVNERPVGVIYEEMRRQFPTESECFINREYPHFQKYSTEELPLNKEKTLELLKQVHFSPLCRFNKLLLG